MTDFLLPSHLLVRRVTYPYLSAVGIARNVYTGGVRTSGLGGDRRALRVEFVVRKRQDRRDIEVFCERANQGNRVYLSDPAYLRPAGSFPAGELFPNTSFTSTTGLTTSSSAITQAVLDRIYRAKIAAAITASTDFCRSSAAVPVTTFAPYALRYLFNPGRYGGTVRPAIRDSGGAALAFGTQAVAEGLHTLAYTPEVSSVLVAVNDPATGAKMAGDYVDIPFASYARCLLVDNKPNAFQRSNELGDAYWTALAVTVGSNIHSDPFGLATMDNVVETTANSQHQISRNDVRASVSEDWCAFGVFVRNVGTRNVRLIIGRDGSNYTHCDFDLGAGTFSAPLNNGDNINGRAAMVPLGNSRYACMVVARLAASTNVLLQANFLNAGLVSYTGDGTSSLGWWGFGAARSSSPILGSQTTTAATLGTAQQGKVIFVKGGPPSVVGAFRAGDWLELISGTRSMKRKLVAQVDFNAAGLGVLQFEQPVQFALADSSPIIVCNPMGKFINMSSEPEYTIAEGGKIIASLDFEEALD